ncbi:MAG: DNA methyltransferase [Armatimonadia bacterium]
MSKLSNNSDSTMEGGERPKTGQGVGEVREWRIADIIIPEGRVARQERVLEIAASIADIGQLQAALLKPDGTLVAGLHRFRACEHLGHETIEARVLTLDDVRMKLAEIDENLIRRELVALERAELVLERKQLYEALHPAAVRPTGGRPTQNGEVPPPFTKVTAKLEGRSPRTVQQDVQIASDIPQDVRDQLRKTPIAANKQELLKLARRDEPTQRKLAGKLAGGTKHLYEAEREVRIDEAQERAKSLPASIPNCQVFDCSCQELIGKIEPGSVDLILADPPYGEAKLISCCEELGRFAAHALSPNGSLLVMVGQMYANAAEEALGHHLFNRWRIIYLMQHGGSPVVPTVQRRVNSSYKPILWLTRPGYDGPVHGDVIDSGPKTKLDHEWEQDVQGVARMVELFSYAGELIVDPFLCTGTTGVAALRLGRRFVGCDIDAEALVGARVRLHDASLEKAA